MKKILFATTVLAMSATVAAAEVSLSGDARMGVIRNFHGSKSGAETFDKNRVTFTSRARVTFNLSGANDSGLSYGASFRADQAVGAGGRDEANGGLEGSVYISGVFGKLSMGKLDGAAAAAVGHVDGVGLTGLGDLNENTFIAKARYDFDFLSGNGVSQQVLTITGNPAAVYEYSFGGATVYASVTKPGFVFTKVITELPGASTSFRSIAYGLGASYSLKRYKVVGGLELLRGTRVSGVAADDIRLTQYSFGGDAGFAGVDVKARYAGGKTELEDGSSTKLNRFSVSGSITVLEFDVTGFYVFDTNTLANGKRTQNVFGLGASYDLGGGAVAKAGIVHNRVKLPEASTTRDTALDLGVSLSF